MDGLQKTWIGVCVSSVLGLAGADYTGYAPGNCTDQSRVSAQATQLNPCSDAYNSRSIRNRHYYGGK